MISLNGNKVISFNCLRRSTHQICLNCGNCAENYEDKYCKYCFERDNWGDTETYMKLVESKYPNLCKKENIFLSNSQKVNSDSFYANFWSTYNNTYDKISKVLHH